MATGKVTQVQVALIVGRYLDDSGYTATLSAFRSEASHLFSRTKGKEPPKGLLSLGDILEEYITLKEQKLMVDQEKKKVEFFMQSVQDAARVYHSSGIPPTLPNLPLPVMRGPVAPLLATNPSSGSYQVGHVINMPITKPMSSTTNAPGINNLSAPNTNPSSKSKRKTSRQAPAAPPPLKKSRAKASGDSQIVGGICLPSQVNGSSSIDEGAGKSSAPKSTPSNRPSIKSVVQGSSVAKSLFKKLPETQTLITSPKTPPQPPPFQPDKSAFPPDSTPLSQCTPSKSKCSVISSRIVVVSPSKPLGYYSIERSHHVSISPLKFSPKHSKRDHVKGRLDFDESEVAVGSIDDNMLDDTFDIDFLDLDVDFSQLLVDFDIDGEEINLHCAPPSNCSADPPTCFNQDNGSGSVETNPSPSDLPSVTGFISKREMDIHGPDSLKSVRSITKCVKIASPAKHQRPSVEQAGLLSTT